MLFDIDDSADNDTENPVGVLGTASRPSISTHRDSLDWEAIVQARKFDRLSLTQVSTSVVSPCEPERGRYRS